MTKAEKIQAASLRLFQRHGFRKVTMSDIADAAEMSRPSLYAAFENKGAVLNAILKDHCARNLVEARERLAPLTSLQARLEAVFAVWIIEPVAEVISEQYALDLLANIASYAPEGVTDMYAHLEEQLIEVLAGAEGAMAPRDLAHILTLAIKGLKASTETLDELRRLADGLIRMAIATTETKA